jgi:hypothetical protein
LAIDRIPLFVMPVQAGIEALNSEIGHGFRPTPE